MTPQEVSALKYVLEYCRPFGYVRGPVYYDGISPYFCGRQIGIEDARKKAKLAQETADGTAKHVQILEKISALIEADIMPSADILEYVLQYLDHPEAGGYSASYDMWARPEPEQIQEEASARILTINDWKHVEKTLKEMIVKALAPNEPIQTDQWGNRFVVVPNTNPPVRKYL